MNFFNKKQLLHHSIFVNFVNVRNNAFFVKWAHCKNYKYTVASVANWYIYIPDFTNLVYFLDGLVGEIMVWYMSLNLVYFYAFW